ncbi:hypothetical protein [Spirosoma fluminis]
MRFQGENCTLSFGLHFDDGQALLTGTIWQRRNRPGELATQPPQLRFRQIFNHSELTSLQRWLAEGSTEPLNIADPIRQIRRISTPGQNNVSLELDYHRESTPDWWEWEVTNPLRIRLDVRPNELDFLIKSLSPGSWPTDLSW